MHACVRKSPLMFYEVVEVQRVKEIFSHNCNYLNAKKYIKKYYEVKKTKKRVSEPIKALISIEILRK